MRRFIPLILAVGVAGCNAEKEEIQNVRVGDRDRSRTAKAVPGRDQSLASATVSVHTPKVEAEKVTSAAAVEATATPAATRTPTEVVASVTPAAPTPVSTSAAASNLASQLLTPPKGNTPQLFRTDPKELQLSESTPLSLQGFNLKGCTVTATAEGDEGQVLTLQAADTSGEELTVSASEWKKLKPGRYTLKVTNRSAETSQLSYPLSVE